MVLPHVYIYIACNDFLLSLSETSNLHQCALFIYAHSFLKFVILCRTPTSNLSNSTWDIIWKILSSQRPCTKFIYMKVYFGAHVTDNKYNISWTFQTNTSITVHVIRVVQELLDRCTLRIICVADKHGFYKFLCRRGISRIFIQNILLGFYALICEVL